MGHWRHRGPERDDLGVGVVTVIGAATGAAFLYGLTVDTPLGVPARPFELAFLALPSIGLLAAAYWMRASDVDSPAVWRAGQYAVTGAIAATTVVVVLLATAKIVSANRSGLFLLLVGSAGEGALLGVIAGLARAIRTDRAPDRSPEDRLLLLHKLLQHNLRNRLNVIAGQSALIEAEGGADADRLASIQTQVEAILSLLDDAKLAAETATEPRDAGPVDLSTILDRGISVIEATYPEASVTADYPDDVTVLGDEVLEAAFENVLDNAVEHNDRAEPSVRVSVDRSGDTVRVKVADDGPGIPEDQRGAVFDESHGGNHGLGLFLTRELVERQGGRIRIESNEPRGTVVVVELPRAPSA